MECIIIAIPKREVSEKIANQIRRKGADVEIRISSSASSVLDKAKEYRSGLVLCMEQVRDMNYSELIDYLPPDFEMIVLTKHVSVDGRNPKVTLVALPLQMSELINLVMERLSKTQKSGLKKKKVHCQRTPEEQKIIDRAKALLMEKNEISEPEAFRMLQKQSMDYGRSMVESAQMILLLNSKW